jgi:hypothetical protein
MRAILSLTLVILFALTGCAGHGAEGAAPPTNTVTTKDGTLKLSVTLGNGLLVRYSGLPTFAVVSPRQISTPVGTPSPGTTRTTVTAVLENAGSEDLEMDVWVEVLSGLHFVADSRTQISEDGRRATRPGVTMRPTEKRILTFSIELDQEYDPGIYVARVNAKGAQQVLTTSVQIKVGP